MLQNNPELKSKIDQLWNKFWSGGISNPLTAIDFYKADHRRQYPEGTTLVYSNFTPRSAKLSNVPAHLFDNRVVLFGLQHFIKHFLIDTWNAEFFHKPKAEVVAKYQRRMTTLVRMQFGSHVYGTNVTTSDHDYKAVHLPPAREILLQRVQNAVNVKSKCRSAGSACLRGGVMVEVVIVRRASLAA